MQRMGYSCDRLKALCLTGGNFNRQTIEDVVKAGLCIIPFL
ncbi:MAG: hypothetical protein ACRC62_06330 [Microcoleus sp.]